MAIMWQHSEGNQHYEVRSAGSTIRLYTNGVFHSQWNPHHVVADALWDLLLLPAFLLPRRPHRVLVLGVGGGAVVRQLRALFRPQELIGIELDPIHLRIAKDWFDVPAKVVRPTSNVKLGNKLGNKSLQPLLSRPLTASGLPKSDKPKEHMVCSDAREWLQAYRGPAFDYIIDDLFGHENGVASRAIDVDDTWANLLLSNLKPDGVLVANFADSREFGKAAKVLRTGGAGSLIYGLSHPRYENKIGVVDAGWRGVKQWKVSLLACDELTALQKRLASAYSWRLYRG